MAKIRVYELARTLNMNNKELLQKIEEMEIEVKSHMSSLDDEIVDKVKEASRVMGDSAFLSIADQKILALALQLKDLSLNPRIFTDDYSIQNVADKICVGFAPLLTLGIRYRFRWTIYCPACYQRYSADYGSQSCQICGTKLKRKPTRKKLI